MATSKRFCTSARFASSSGDEMKEIARPLVPKRPARPTRWSYWSAGGSLDSSDVEGKS
jgi:hypothetical protein